VFTSDHGSQFPFGKWNGYDAGVRTPLVVAWPGKVKPGTTTAAMVSWIDLLPTCLDAAGGKVPAVSGRSFCRCCGASGRTTATRCSSPTAATGT